MTRSFIILLMVLLTACIDPVSFKFEGQQEHLVVEAKFTNDADHTYIKLSRSQPYTSPYNVLIRDAQIWITDADNHTINFLHEADGVYKLSENTAGLPGQTYQLHIVTSGKSYTSAPATMPSPVTIDTIAYAYDQRYTVFQGQAEKVLADGYSFRVNYTDPKDQHNYYRWSYDSQFEVLTQPRDYVEYDCKGCPRPAPKNCCSQCWIQEQADMVMSQSDRLSDGMQVLDQEVLFIPFEKFMNIKYKLTLYQHSLSEEVYQFYQALTEQSENTGSIFDAPPSELKGNIYNPEDTIEQVLGVFEVSAVSSKNIVVTPFDIPYKINEFIYPDDCREMDHATTTRPSGW